MNIDSASLVNLFSVYKCLCACRNVLHQSYISTLFPEFVECFLFKVMTCSFQCNLLSSEKLIDFCGKNALQRLLLHRELLKQRPPVTK